jgi:serine protease Do
MSRSNPICRAWQPMISGACARLRIGGVVALMAIMLSCSATFAVAEDVGTHTSDLIRGLLPTVVNIAVRKEVPTEARMANAGSAFDSGNDVSKSFVGSGFIIDPSGLIVTNYHVVDGAYEISVTLSDGTVLPGKLVHASRVADLAVVQVQVDHPLTPVQWGDSTKIRVGDEVFAIGNPLGIGMSVSSGIVSGLNRDVQDSPYDDYIQTDAAINHGNSGGPLFDMEGRVIGINTALVSPTDASAGLGLAIPSESVQFVVDRLMKYGWVRPGWMGVKVQQITREMAEAMGTKPEGSVVAWVMPDGPAHKAGIEIGDVILKYGDDAPGDERALLRDIGRTSVGETVPVVVLRDGVEHNLPVAIAAWPRSQWDERDAPMTAQRPKLTIPPDLGLSLSAIETNQRAKLGLEDGLSGVMVNSVLPGSDAAHRGVGAGDVILRVQDKPMAQPGDVQHAISALRGENRPFVMMLVLPKVRKIPGPEWVVLRLEAEG